MRRRIFLVILLFIAVMCVLSSCAKKEKPILRVGTNPEYPPFGYKIGEQLTGIDIDLSRKVAEKLKMEIMLIPMPFEELFTSLASDKIDAAISAITITPERSHRFDFSPPYATTNQVLIAKEDSPIVIEKIEDIGKHTVGSLAGTTGHIYLDDNLIDRDLMPKTKLLLFPTNLEAIGKMLNGEIDFVIIDESAAMGYAKQKPIKIAYTIKTNERYGIAMQKGKAINDKINKALSELIEAGEVELLMKTYMK